MTSKEWLDNVRFAAPSLRKLIESHHPLSDGYHAIGSPHLPITAGAAEEACEVIRRNIKKEHPDLNPIVEFDTAVEYGRVDVIITLLSQTWYGVPESSECWAIAGFPQAVALLDDPPDDIPDGVEDMPSSPTSPDKE